ncbi:MAG: precorrin-2 C(20)-methyltransferase [Desulfarculus sp.]|nr:precorrin-2 C(20)-methyltransferase [Desulfarculus sp.]
MSQDNQRGTLYGLGVGPGDPGLLTLKAVEVLKRVPVLFAAGSSKNEYSLAFNVVAAHLPASVEVRKLDFPMTHDQASLDAAWRANALAVKAVLDSGRDAAFITIGDPLTYSTYGYLLQTLKAIDPAAKVETVPGVTAYQAAAARLNLPLVESRESLMVVSGVSDLNDIPALAACGDNLVIMKTYKNFDQIIDKLDELPVRRKTYCVSQCGLPDERVVMDATTLKGQKMPYLSLILVKGPAEAKE